MGQMEDMETFVRIVDAGSISRAAAQLGVVKSAVSRRLNDLEKRLGVQLLARTTRTSSLTEAGQRYFARAQVLLTEVAEINAEAAQTSTSLTGTIKLTAPLSFGLSHLSPIISGFAKAHPELNIHMDFNDRQVDLVDEGYDLAIRIANLKDSTLKARKLIDISLVLCASPDYVRLHGAPLTPADLKQHQILHYTSSGTDSWAFTTPSGGKASLKPPAKMHSNNGDFLCQAAVDGHGIILSPSFIVWKALRQKKLVPLMCGFRPQSITAYAVYPATRHLPARIRLLIESIANQLKVQPHWDAPKTDPAP
ncbi:MAG: LysR family transcriptional regulator [Rhodobacteraceae bacterium]|nr:LysR family transcriptional regulator [Paracoccaceae bacterium]